MKWHQRFLWILLVLLPTQLGVHFWPAWAGVLGRRVDYLAPAIYLTDTLIFLIILVWLVPRVIQMVRRNPKSKFLNPKQIQRIKNQMFQTKHLWAMAGVVFVAVNIFVASNQPVAIYKWIKVSEFVLLGWYIVKTKPALSMIITPLSIGVFYSSVLAIAQFFLQHSVGGPLWWLGERTFDADTPGIARVSMCQWIRGLWSGCPELLRPYGTFPHPNVLGGYIAAILPLAIIQLSNNPIIKLSNSKKIFYLMTIVFGIIALLLTFSRSAVVVGVIAIVLTILRMRNYARPERGRRELRIKEHAAIKFFPIILYSLFFILLFVMIANLDIREESVVVRKELNSAAVKLWQSSPLLGVGLGNFLVRLPEALPTRTIYFLQPVHNIYLLLLSEVGIVGVGLIALWIVVQSQKWKVYSVKKKWNSLFTLHFSLFTLLLLGLVDHYPLTLQQGQIMLTLLLGLVVSMSKSDQSGPIRPMND